MPKCELFTDKNKVQTFCKYEHRTLSIELNQVRESCSTKKVIHMKTVADFVWLFPKNWLTTWEERKCISCVMMIILYESRSADSLGRRAQKGIYEKEGEGEGQKMRNGEFGGRTFWIVNRWYPNHHHIITTNGIPLVCYEPITNNTIAMKKWLSLISWKLMPLKELEL